MTSLWMLVHTLTAVTLTAAFTVKDDTKNVKYEEYIIEHEISTTQARNVALSNDVDVINVPAGCQECTRDEKRYCMSSDLISDHCCCDRRFHEFLPYIPHTCYFGSQLCTTVALDCNKYTRLRTCCCDTFLRQKWREKYGYSKSPQGSTNSVIFLVFALLILIYLM